MLFEGEVDRGEREIATLRHENQKLRTAVQSLAAVAPSPQQPSHCDQQRPRRQSAGVSAEASSRHAEHQCNQSVSEAQRVAAVIDDTSRSVVVETMRVGRRLECDVDNYLDTALAESAKTIEYVDTALTDSVKTMESKGNDVLRDVDHYLDTALAESAKAVEYVDTAWMESLDTMESKRNDFLQAIEELSADPSGLAKKAQSQLEEQAEAFRASLFRSSLWQRGDGITSDQDGVTDTSAPALIPLNDELGGKAIELQEKAQEHIQALGATFGWWSQDPKNAGK
jgi:hypothetical protein